MAKKKILVVDDEQELVAALKIRLEANDFEVIAAYDGEEALEKAKEKPDLILLDILMPKMDGYKVLSKLRQAAQTKNIPVIMLTAKGESQSIFKAHDLGSTDYIIKPFEQEELLELINKYIWYDEEGPKWLKKDYW